MIPLLPVEEAMRRGKEAGVPEALAGLNIFRAMLHNPVVAGPAAKLLTTLLFNGKLDQRIRELAVLRIGWRSTSEYEFCQHVQVARRLKMSDEEILGIREPDKCVVYGEVDRAVIRMTDELLDRARVSPDTWATVEKAIPTEQLVELVLAIGNWRMIAMFLNAGKVPLDADVPSWPEGKAPL